jgi:CHAD domain-containing protein
MGFRFEKEDADLAAGMRRIAAEEVARAEAEIADPDLPTARKIHQARKRTKRVRGLLRLLRPAFPDYRAEAAHLREAARGLSHLRDRDVMIATHDALMAATGAERARYAPVRAHLTRARNRVVKRMDPDAALATYMDEMRTLAARAPDWRIAGKDKAALKAGLARTWTRARKAMKAARKQDDIEHLHEFRKRVKDHWYQARLLVPLDPGPIREQAQSAGDLGEILGDIHDLDVYRAHLHGPEATGLDPERRAELVTLATERIAALEGEAFAIGKRLFAPSPDELADDWAKKWKAWRKASRPSGKRRRTEAA